MSTINTENVKCYYIVAVLDSSDRMLLSGPLYIFVYMGRSRLEVCYAGTAQHHAVGSAGPDAAHLKLDTTFLP